VLAGKPRPLPQHVGEIAVDAAALFLLAAEQRDALAVLPHAGQGVAQVGLGLVLVLGDLHEAAADHGDRARGDRRIEHGGDDEEAGDGDLRLPERHGERAADGPEHDNESRRRQERRCHAGHEIDRRVGRDPQIFGDAVFRILVVAADQVELVVAPVVEPARQHRIGQPGAPAALDAHARVNLRHADQHAADRERKEHRREEIDGCGIAFLDAVEDRPVPDIDAVLQADIADDQDEKPDGERPGQPVAVAAPATARADPEPRQQIAPARLFHLFRRHLRIRLDHLGRRRLDDLVVALDDVWLLAGRFLCGCRLFLRR
jgi:hypothetical protein